MWEHKAVNIDYPRSPERSPEIQQKLDDASSEGWELVSVCSDAEMDVFFLFFKRPKA